MVEVPDAAAVYVVNGRDPAVIELNVVVVIRGVPGRFTEKPSADEVYDPRGGV